MISGIEWLQSLFWGGGGYGVYEAVSERSVVEVNSEKWVS